MGDSAACKKRRDRERPIGKDMDSRPNAMESADAKWCRGRTRDRGRMAKSLEAKAQVVWCWIWSPEGLHRPTRLKAEWPKGITEGDATSDFGPRKQDKQNSGRSGLRCEQRSTLSSEVEAASMARLIRKEAAPGGFLLDAWLAAVFFWSWQSSRGCLGCSTFETVPNPQWKLYGLSSVKADIDRWRAGSDVRITRYI